MAAGAITLALEERTIPTLVRRGGELYGDRLCVVGEHRLTYREPGPPSTENGKAREAVLRERAGPGTWNREAATAQPTAGDADGPR